MERLPIGRQASEHNLYVRTYPSPIFVEGVDTKICSEEDDYRRFYLKYFIKNWRGGKLGLIRHKS